MICLTQISQKQNEWYIRISSIKQCIKGRKIANVLISNWLRVVTNANIIKRIDKNNKGKLLK